MSGFVPKRVLNARISSNIEKNQTPMQAGLAPRVGKSGASIRLYYQRVDGCECICNPFNDPVVIKRRLLIPGNLEEMATTTDTLKRHYNNSSGWVRNAANTNWEIPPPSFSNYNKDGDQSDRIYYAIILSRSITSNSAVTPTNPLKLGFRVFKDNSGNIIDPGRARGEGEYTPNVNASAPTPAGPWPPGSPGLVGGQFIWTGSNPSGNQSGVPTYQTMFRSREYTTGTTTGYAMTFGNDDTITIPASDYSIIQNPGCIQWSSAPVPVAPPPVPGGGHYLWMDYRY